eukprot:scaffold70106_cov71-Phaeocystis_antarctica.AAC.2
MGRGINAPSSSLGRCPVSHGRRRSRCKLFGGAQERTTTNYTGGAVFRPVYALPISPGRRARSAHSACGPA